jgi:hypothetical protein
MAISILKLFKNSNIPLIEVAVLVDAPKSFLANCMTQLPTAAPINTSMDFPGSKPSLSRPSYAV